MINPNTWFFVGALAGASTAAIVALAASNPNYIAVCVAILWGIPAALLTIREAIDNLAAPQIDAPAVIADSVQAENLPGDVIDQDGQEQPSRTVYFSAATAAAAGTAARRSIFDGVWPAQPAQPPTTTATTPPLNRQNGHAPSQPVAQPVAKGLDLSWLDEIAAFHAADDVDLPTERIVPPPPPPHKPAPWDDIAVADYDDQPDDDDDASPPTAAPLLPRRRPTAADYPAIWGAVNTARSLNAAVKALWGAKDGKTWGWLTMVIGYYTDYSYLPIWVHELLGTQDAPADVLERLGLPALDAHEIGAILLDHNVTPCDQCARWHEADPADIEDGTAICSQCRDN